jgi:hypothetical protein
MPSSMPMNSPKSVMFLTGFEDGALGVLLGHQSQGLGDLLHAERDALAVHVHAEDDDIHFVAGATIWEGWRSLRVQDISEMCTRPSTPGSSSTNAP